MSFDIAIVGRGKVGRALAAALLPVVHRGGREPPVPLRAEVVLFAVRDGQLPTLATAYAGYLEADVVLHVAGAVNADVLAPLRPAAVGQWHPVLSFVDDDVDFQGAAALITGDAKARVVGGQLAKRLGMRAVEAQEHIDLALYHAALALSANGMAALAASAERLLGAAGLEGEAAEAMLGPLLASVAANVGRVGAAAAMSGPVRRGDASTIARHLARLTEVAPEELPLYRASVQAQLAIARRLGEASPEALQGVAATISDVTVSTMLQETDESGPT